jgi:hypothetical protein
VNGVGAGLDGGLDDRTAGAAELGGSDGGVDPELLGALDVGEEDEGVDECFVIVDAVKKEVVRRRSSTIHPGSFRSRVLCP